MENLGERLITKEKTLRLKATTFNDCLKRSFSAFSACVGNDLFQKQSKKFSSIALYGYGAAIKEKRKKLIKVQVQ